MNLPPFSTLGDRYRIPDSAELDADRKALLLGAAKIVLTRLQKKGAVPAKVAYDDVVSTPRLLHKAFEGFRENPDLNRDLVIDARGRPVRPEDRMGLLVCGTTLEQVEKMIVLTCAKKVFRDNLNKVQREEAKTNYKLLKPYLAYAWQVQLLEIFRDQFSYAHLRYLGQDIMMIRTPEAANTVASYSPMQIDKARKTIGDRFPEMLYTNAGAIGGVLAIRKPGQLEMMEEAVGGRLWEFFARDPQYVIEALSFNQSDLNSIGPIITDMCLDALITAIEIPPRVIRPLMKVFPEVLGKHLATLLRSEEFVKDFFRPIVIAFKELEFRDESADAVNHVVTTAARLKINANKAKIRDWMEERGFGASRPAA